MPDLPPPVELIPADEDEVTSVRTGTHTDGWHVWLRTAAVVVGAASLVWMGFSFSGVRDADARQACFQEIQMAMYGPAGPRTDEDTATRLVERADDCGLSLLADVLRDDLDVEE